jgi:hypothetical protein
MSVRGCNMDKFLVVPTFAARRIEICKDTSAKVGTNYRKVFPVILFHAISVSLSASPNMSW